MIRPRIGVLGLQGAIAEHRRALASLGADSALVRAPADIDGLDGLIIPGGESTTMIKLSDALRLTEPLRAAIADGLPTFGTCAGMIMVADEILDGRDDQTSVGGVDIQVRRNAFGRQIESFECDVAVPAIGEPPFRAVFIRAPWVESVGPTVEVLARVEEPQGHDDRGGRIVAVRQERVMAVAFHPELTADNRLHRLFLSMVGA